MNKFEKIAIRLSKPTYKHLTKDEATYHKALVEKDRLEKELYGTRGFYTYFPKKNGAINWEAVSNGYFCKYEDKILDFLDKKDLKLIHLYNLDQYVIVDKKSIGKSITIKATIGAKSHLIGRHGNNIDRIKQINNFKNISVCDIENEEYLLLKKELAKKLEFLINQEG